MNNTINNTIIPIFIPTDSESEKCPKCHKEENIQQVCKHCGYVYPEEEYENPFSWWQWIIIVLLLIILIDILCVIFYWLFQDIHGYKVETLFEVFKNNWEGISDFFGKLRIK